MTKKTFQYHLVTAVVASVVTGFMLSLNMIPHVDMSKEIAFIDLHAPREYGWPISRAVVYEHEILGDDIGIVGPQIWKIDWQFGVPINALICTVIIVLSGCISERCLKRLEKKN